MFANAAKPAMTPSLNPGLQRPRIVTIPIQELRKNASAGKITVYPSVACTTTVASTQVADLGKLKKMIDSRYTPLSYKCSHDGSAVK